MLGRFNKIFGIQESLATEQARFVQRINQTAFERIEDLRYPDKYKNIFETICYWLGVNAVDRIARANQMNYGVETRVPSLRSLTGDDFMQTLKVLVLLYQRFSKNSDEQQALSDWIEAALSNATIDIGVRWKEGMFYPSGAKELDEKLVEEPLEWLSQFQEERADYLKALVGYSNNRIDDVVGNCYLVIEGLTRKILGNRKTLDNNREEIVKKTKLSQEWKAILSNFINYANEFKRHASEKRHAINPIEVEAFLYMTGLLVRMLVESKSISEQKT